MSNPKCKLLPYIRKDILSLQEAKQNSGWNITAFNLPETWKYSQGEGVKVAVLDTGCQINHVDLVENLLKGKNFVEIGKPPTGQNAEHATHCAGTICAVNNDIGVVGVAPKAKVMPVKVLGDDGSGDFLTVSKGVRWAVDAGADIISMSLGCPVPLQQVRKAIQYATNKGIPVFAAAGNAGANQLYYPAAYPETISVAAVDKNFKRAIFSNIGKNLDFVAPGVDILSTVPTNWYAMMSGTSMATPWIAGIAALMLSYARKTNKIKLNSVEDYRNLFRQQMMPLNESCLKGVGILDPKKFLDWIDD